MKNKEVFVMKRFLCFLLILSILIPSVSFAIGDSPFYGRWIAQKHGATSSYSAILYYLEITKYTTSEYFEICLNNGGVLTKGKITDYDVYSDHWEIVDNHLRVPTSGIAYIEVFYDKDSDTLYTTEYPKLTFVRIP